jgi:hypothetical protein
VSDLLAPFDTVGPPVPVVLTRLVMAVVLGFLVSLVYRWARSEPASSFTTTLVLLTPLIAMVTQVIGDNVARAFSLVGALSIVRFRTVVRDTQDTAYVIFAVAVGMAVGGSSVWVALGGIAVIGIAALALKGQSAVETALPFTLQVRLGLGHDVTATLGPVLDIYLSARRIVQVATARQGIATEVTFRAALRRDDAAHDLVLALNRVEGVQAVTLDRSEMPPS